MKTVKLFTLLIGTMFLATTISCSDDQGPTIDYSVAETQLNKDYSNISNLKWSTNGQGYQIATFSGNKVARADAQSMTAWYAVAGTKATLEMDSRHLGVMIPEIIKPAFRETDYSKDDLWRVEEVELDYNYNNNSVTSYYELELVNIANANLEAELLFDAISGKLIFAKEELDNDGDNDQYVITAALKAAVEEAVPGAIIIDAEVEDNFIEVDAYTITNGIQKEIELVFSMTYDLVSSETETEYSYSTLPTEFSAIPAWFAANTSTPAPLATTDIEITELLQTESDNAIGEYFYEVEIDEYKVGDNEYEVEFYLNKEYAIVAVIVNDDKVAI